MDKTIKALTAVFDSSFTVNLLASSWLKFYFRKSVLVVGAIFNTWWFNFFAGSLKFWVHICFGCLQPTVFLAWSWYCATNRCPFSQDKSRKWLLQANLKNDREKKIQESAARPAAAKKISVQLHYVFWLERGTMMPKAFEGSDDFPLLLYCQRRSKYVTVWPLFFLFCFFKLVLATPLMLPLIPGSFKLLLPVRLMYKINAADQGNLSKI